MSFMPSDNSPQVTLASQAAMSGRGLSARGVEGGGGGGLATGVASLAPLRRVAGRSESLKRAGRWIFLRSSMVVVVVAEFEVEGRRKIEDRARVSL